MKKRNFKSRLISAISAVICAITFCAGSVNVDMLKRQVLQAGLHMADYIMQMLIQTMTVNMIIL